MILDPLIWWCQIPERRVATAHDVSPFAPGLVFDTNLYIGPAVELPANILVCLLISTTRRAYGLPYRTSHSPRRTRRLPFVRSCSPSVVRLVADHASSLVLAVNASVDRSSPRVSLPPVHPHSEAKELVTYSPPQFLSQAHFFQNILTGFSPLKPSDLILPSCPNSILPRRPTSVQ
jgi:hypothetical protein